MHYYQFNIGDYAKHTRHLTLMEDLAYRRLLDFYYDTEKPLPVDVKKLSRLVGMPDHQNEISQVLEDFFSFTDGGYSQKRVDDELARFSAKADAARENGKKGGRPKKPKKTQSVNLANPEETGSKANQEPITNNQQPLKSKPLSGKPDAYTPEFLKWWSLYPKKTGKGAAGKKWKKLNVPLSEALEALAWQTVSQHWLDGFIPNPETYLNQRRWEDEPCKEIIPVQRGPKTFKQQKMDNTKKAMMDFLQEDQSNDGFGQSEILSHDGGAGDFLSIGFDE